MDKTAIKALQTYSSKGGLLLYVHEISGQKVTYCVLGSVNRQECSLGRFASRIDAEVPNQ